MGELGSGGPAGKGSPQGGESRLEGLCLDGTGLILSLSVGWLVVLAVALALARAVPASHGRVPVPALLAFSIGFVGLDYLQYWTHRLFHGRVLWRFHLLHHTLVRMHGLGAFRHSFWECALSPVFWCHGIIAWLLADPRYYLAAASTTLVLDVWRHAEVESSGRGPLGRALCAVLVTPGDHAVHHQEPAIAGNYGGNLKVWDRLHGTYHPPDGRPAAYGVPKDGGRLRLLFGAARTDAGVVDGI